MNATAELDWIGTSKQFDGVVKRVEAAQAQGMDVRLDFHGRVHRPLAKQLAKVLEPLGLLFIEEPLLSENMDGLPEIAAHTTTPIALGERLFDRWEFKPFFEQGAVDIIQPDLSHAGGISEVRKIAAMAEAYDVAVAPHCPLGPLALGRLPPDRGLHAQSCDPGDQPRHSLQHRRARSPQLLHQQGSAYSGRRLSAGARRAGARRRHRRSRGARGGQGPPPLAQPDLPDKGRRVRGVVTCLCSCESRSQEVFYQLGPCLRRGTSISGI